MKKNFIIVFVVVVVVTLVVISTSTIFFSRHLRLYDYGPPLGAGIIMLGMMIRAALSGR